MKSYLKLMLLMGLVFGLFFGMGAGLTKLMQPPSKAESKEPVKEEEQYPEDEERTNILVLGVDARPGEKNSRSDTILLFSVDPKLDKVAVISIPRDTRIEIQGGYKEKICAANFIGGPEYAVDRVENLMHTNIDHYVLIDFKGFEKIIDIIGGVTIDVPQRMYKPSEGIDLKPGKGQRLNGKDALAFVRFRDYVNGDIDRTHQQQVFIKALAKEVLQPKTITRLPSMIKELKQYVKTDIGFTDMLKMASWAPGFNADSIITQTLPGSFYDEVDGNGNLLKSYWLADEDAAANLLENLFAGKTVAVVQQSPPPLVIGGPAKNEEDTEPKSVADSERNSEEENATENDEENSESEEPTDYIPGLEEQRNNLPSPGHNEEFELPPTGTVDPVGPEGYI